MKIVVLERNSVGLDVSIDGIEALGEVTVYPNTTRDDIDGRLTDAEIIVANKAPLNEETLKDASKVRLICEFATGYDNIDLAYCKSRGIKVANVVTIPPTQWRSILLLFVFMSLKNFATTTNM